MAEEATVAEALANHVDDLKLDDKPRVSQEGKKDSPLDKRGSVGGASNSAGEDHQQAGGTQHAANGGPANAGAALPDPAVLSALMDHTKERPLVLRMEQDVLAFLADPSRDIFEFPVDFTNYQRMLAHKVAQYHGLQTSTADFEGNQCRVIAHRAPGHGDKSKPLLVSMDLSPGSSLAALAAKGSATWQEAPKLLRRPGSSRHYDRPAAPGDSGNNSNSSSARTPKDREEDYDRARARILEGSLPAAPGAMAVPGSAGRGRGVIAGRGRRGGRSDRTGDMHDSEYMRGIPRFGLVGMYDGTQPVSPVFMAPHGGPVMYAMAQQPEMAWRGMYVPGRQPPPPPPSSNSSSYGHKGGAGNTASANSMWMGNSTSTPSGSAMSSSTAGGSTAHSGQTAVVPPPPPPPPHPAGARPYQPTTPTAMTPMAMYPSPGGMQPMPGGPVYTYMAYPGYTGPMHAGMAYPGMMHAAYPGSMPGYPGAVPAAYPAGAMQTMTAQGYGTVYTTAPASAGGAVAATAMPGVGSPGGMPHHPHALTAARPTNAGPAMQMAYPVHAMPSGYQAVPYPMAMHSAPAGVGPAAAQVHYGTAMIPHGAHMGQASYHNTGGGRGGRGGYRQQQHGSTSHGQQHGQAQPPPPPANGSIGSAAREGSTGSTTAAAAAAAANGK